MIRETYQTPKVRPPSKLGTPLPDGKPFCDVERLLGQIGLHVSRGEWKRASELLDAAYRYANHRYEGEEYDDDRILVGELDIDQKLKNMLDKAGYVFANEVAVLSPANMLAIKGMGEISAVQIFIALQKVGLR